MSRIKTKRITKQNKQKQLFVLENFIVIYVISVSDLFRICYRQTKSIRCVMNLTSCAFDASRSPCKFSAKGSLLLFNLATAGIC
jgi:hypothetical protein